MSTSAQPEPQSATPSFDRARVADIMRTHTLTAPPTASLRQVARTMSEHGVHCIVVSDVDRENEPVERAWGIVSAFDVVRAALSDVDEHTAAGTASTEVVTVGADEPLERAAQLMAEHEVWHLVVVEGGRPVGIVSTLDIARALT